MYYLLKTEPSTYSFDDLVREKQTTWDGVTNPVALRNLGNMKPGDELVIYHTGDEKSAVGTASVVSVDASNSKSPAVKIKIKAGKKLDRAVSLSEVKSTSEFADSPLVRQPRLSVVPLNEKQYRYLIGR
jgi:predicted RNA-binding protein with PUA-like domain